LAAAAPGFIAAVQKKPAASFLFLQRLFCIQKKFNSITGDDSYNSPPGAVTGATPRHAKGAPGRECERRP
jgi:hypothetical protein